MVRWKRDVIYGVVFLMFCAVNFIYSRSIEQTATEVTLAKPEIYLNLWLVIFATLSILMIIKAVRKRPEEVLKPIFQKLTVVTIVLFTLYLLVLPYIGFLFSTIVILCCFIHGLWLRRN